MNPRPVLIIEKLGNRQKEIRGRRRKGTPETRGVSTYRKRPPALEYLPFYEGVMDLWSPVAPGSLGVGRKIFIFYTVTRHVICASKCARECGKTDNGESEGKSSRSTVWASSFFGAGASRDVHCISPSCSRRQQGLSAWSRSS